MRVNMLEEVKVEYKDIAMESTGRVLRDLMVTEKMQRSVVTDMVDVIKEICIYCFINIYILLS